MSERDHDPTHGGPTTGAGRSEDLGDDIPGDDEVTGGGGNRQGDQPSERMGDDPEQQRDQGFGDRGTESRSRSAIQG